MSGRTRWVATGALGGVAFVLVVLSASATARSAARALGAPSRDEVAQWWRHRGSDVERLPEGRHLTLLITGQSNAGSYASGAWQRSSAGVFNAHRGRLYLAQDPLLGSDGHGVSPWISVARALRDQGLADSVVLALAVRGGAAVRAWDTDGSMRREVFDRLRELRAWRLEPDYVLWQQGETDAAAGTSGAEYERVVRDFIDALRSAGLTAPIIVATATRTGNADRSDAIRMAQAAVVDQARHVLAGPDIDQLGLPMRTDGLHFSDAGVAALARLWVGAIVATGATINR